MRAVLSAGRQIQEIQRRRSASDLLAQELGRESPVPSKIWTAVARTRAGSWACKWSLCAENSSLFCGLAEIMLPPDDPRCAIFATLRHYFGAVTVWGRFSVPMSPSYNNRGRPQMSIDTLLLILLVAFGAGFVLNRLDFGRRTRRFG
jgi:hypothetical protein